jgi:hypothetical protein
MLTGSETGLLGANFVKNYYVTMTKQRQAQANEDSKLSYSE